MPTTTTSPPDAADVAPLRPYLETLARCHTLSSLECRILLWLAMTGGASSRSSVASALGHPLSGGFRKAWDRLLKSGWLIPPAAPASAGGTFTAAVGHAPAVATPTSPPSPSPTAPPPTPSPAPSPLAPPSPSRTDGTTPIVASSPTPSTGFAGVVRERLSTPAAREALDDILLRVGGDRQQRQWLAELAFALDGAHGRAKLTPEQAERAVTEFAAKEPEPFNFGRWKAYLARSATPRPASTTSPTAYRGQPTPARPARGQIVG